MKTIEHEASPLQCWKLSYMYCHILGHMVNLLMLKKKRHIFVCTKFHFCCVLTGKDRCLQKIQRSKEWDFVLYGKGAKKLSILNKRLSRLQTLSEWDSGA